ncbi:MAG: signal peptidase I [Dehalococcoidia bacterium]|nr:signal peptidase I [Dehalococcoidia bacterium]
MERNSDQRPMGLAHLPALLLAKRVVISGWSMTPTLVPGERVLVNRLAYRRHPPARGDVVLAEDPRGGRTLFVKRVLGCPGDVVQATTEGLRVNGKLAQELGPSESRSAPASWTLGTDDYFLVGDAADIHSAMSTDSRTFGPVPRRLIRGRVWMVYWPPSRARRID